MKIKIANDADLKQKYADAKAIKKPSPAQARQRGYELESILEYLLASLEVRTSYKAESEQIDGSFFIWGQTFLLEAKWHSDPLPVSSIYSFKGKVDGKFHTTSGVFIAINGYSKDAVTALRYGKTINTILFEGSDLDAVIEQGIAFEDVLKYKLRMAGDTGSPLALYKLVKTAKSSIAAAPVLSGSTISFHGTTIGNEENPYLVFYSSAFKSFQLEKVFADLDTSNVVAYKFNQLNADENPLDTIPIMINLYADAEEEIHPKAIIIILDKNYDSKDVNSNLKFNLPDILEKASQTIPVAIFDLNADQVNNILQNGNEANDLTGVASLITYLEDQIQTDNLFYEDDEAYKAIKKSLEEAEWDYSARIVYFPNDYDNSQTSITSYEELQTYLAEIALQAASDMTPNEILKEGDFPEYDEQVEEILTFYTNNIIRMGWKQ